MSNGAIVGGAAPKFPAKPKEVAVGSSDYGGNVDLRGPLAIFFLPKVFAKAIEAGIEGINVRKVYLIYF